MKILSRLFGKPRENLEEDKLKIRLNEKMTELDEKTSELREVIKKALARKEVREQ